jgi:hypothetical protein
MAAGNRYAVEVWNPEATRVLEAYSLLYTDSTAQPALSAPPITSGTLPNTGAWVSGTAKVNPVARAITVAVEIVGDATNNVASCVIALSPDNSTFTTLATPSIAAALNNTGAITMAAMVPVPQGWYIKLTLTHVTVAASIYF